MGDLIPSATVLSKAAERQDRQSTEVSPLVKTNEETQGLSTPDPHRGTPDRTAGRTASAESKQNSGSISTLFEQQSLQPVPLINILPRRFVAPRPSVIVRISFSVLSRRLETIQTQRTAAGAAGPSPVLTTSISYKARQIAQWIHRQLQDMETHHLLHSRPSSRGAGRENLCLNPQQQSADTIPNFWLQPAGPPPPPTDEAAAAAAATRGAAAAAATPGAAAPVPLVAAAKIAPITETIAQIKEETGDRRDRKRRQMHPLAETDLELLPIAQQKWRHRKKHR